MSSIVLSSAVRQNLLALQNTASLISTTQNRLATGKSVNSALDNPTNYFTAAGLDNRASDINNLLDGISNGVQVLQSANTGITSLQSLVNSAKSIANQALQTTIGYSTKAGETSAAITRSGAAVDASDLRGIGTVTSTSSAGSAISINGASATMAGTTKLAALGITTTDSFTDLSNGVTTTISFDGNTGSTVTNGTAVHLDLATATVADLETALTAADGGTWGVAGGKITLTTGANGNTLTDATAGTLAKIGITSGTATAATTAIAGAAVAAPTVTTTATGTTKLAAFMSNGATLSVNGYSISLSGTGAAKSISSTGATLDVRTSTVQDLLTAIDTITGTGTASTIGGGAITLNTGTNNDINITSSSGATANGAFLAGLVATNGTTSKSVQRTGLTATFTGVGSASGTSATITFGDGTNNTVKTLNDLNSKLSSLNLVASIDSSGKLTVNTNNDNASASFTASTGTTATAGSGLFNSSNGATVVTAPIVDAAAQSTRAGLINQYNTIVSNIDSTAADASYNGVNLLAGDQMQLTFDETGKAKLNITGVTFNASGLGLSALTAGTDFIDNAATNKVLAKLNSAQTTLRSQAAAFGSNLSVVQTRQDFNKSLVNVLQTGSSNLTSADMNEEAANSQALQTRQSLSVSALSLANQAQQSVLQLLR